MHLNKLLLSLIQRLNTDASYELVLNPIEYTYTNQLNKEYVMKKQEKCVPYIFGSNISYCEEKTRISATFVQLFE